MAQNFEIPMTDIKEVIGEIVTPESIGAVEKGSYGVAKMEKGYYSHQTDVGGAIVGYVKFCRLEIIAPYANFPITFNIRKRALFLGCNVELFFNNGATLETTVAKFTKDNNNLEFDIIAVPFGSSESSNIFDLYIYKGMRNDWINFKLSMQNIVNGYIRIDWKNEFIQNESDIPNLPNATHAILRDLTVNNIVAANYIGTNLLVGLNQYTGTNYLPTLTSSTEYVNTGVTAQITNGKTYTFSLNMKPNTKVIAILSKKPTWNGTVSEAYAFFSNHELLNYSPWKNTLPVTFTADVSGTAYLLVCYSGSIAGGTKITAENNISNVKLELGTHATQYTPNLEEMQQLLMNINNAFVELKDASEEKKNEYNFVGSYAKSDTKNGSAGLYLVGEFQGLPIIYLTEETTYNSYAGGMITTISLPIGYYRAKSVVSSGTQLSICDTAGNHIYLGKSYLIAIH